MPNLGNFMVLQNLNFKISVADRVPAQTCLVLPACDYPLETAGGQRWQCDYQARNDYRFSTLTSSVSVIPHPCPSDAIIGH